MNLHLSVQLMHLGGVEEALHVLSFVISATKTGTSSAHHARTECCRRQIQSSPINVYIFSLREIGRGDEMGNRLRSGVQAHV